MTIARQDNDKTMNREGKTISTQGKKDDHKIRNTEKTNTRYYKEKKKTQHKEQATTRQRT